MADTADVTAQRTSAQCATAQRYELGEGVLWDDRARLVRWVDIPRGLLLSGRLGPNGRIDEAERVDLGDDATAVILTETAELVVGLGGGVARVLPDRTVARGPSLLAPGRKHRMNDAAADPAGRIVIGSIAQDEGAGEEVLLCIDTDGTVRTLRSRVVASNGIGFAPDGSRIYHVDTGRRTVAAADYDVSTGAVGTWATVVTVTDGYPDGLAVDSQGLLWVAVWGAGQVRRFDATGRVTAVIDVPAPHVSSMTFAGEDLTTLVISTARSGLSRQERDRYPASGALFVADVSAAGLLPARARVEGVGPAWNAAAEVHRGRRSMPVPGREAHTVH